MNILYLLIISILLVIFYQTQIRCLKEKFTDNIFSHVFENNYQSKEAISWVLKFLFVFKITKY